MDTNEKKFFINHPVFVKYKTLWDLRRFKKHTFLKSVAINERIIEIPLAIQWLSRMPADSTVLDLGCAESALPLFLSGTGYRVTGCDYRPYPYCHPNLNFVRGDILQLPFADEKYDAVMCISTLEHIGMGFYQDPLLSERADKTAILEMYRVLKKSGLFILSVPFGIGIENPQQRVYDELTLSRLLQNFNIEEARYFQNPGTGRICPESWVEITKDQAATIKSDATSRCICMLRARK
jgi:SAM-dependent methyltransferase